MFQLRNRRAGLRAAVVAPVVVLMLSACGGPGAGSSSASATPNANATGAPGNGRRFDGQQLEAIQACLRAAGISLPTPSRPGNVTANGTPPSGVGNGAPPSGGLGNGPRPTGSGFPGRGQSPLFRSKKVQTALKACGITLPTSRPRTFPTAAA